MKEKRVLLLRCFRMSIIGLPKILFWISMLWGNGGFVLSMPRDVYKRQVDYGPFSYYTGGDLSSYVYDEQGNALDVETLVGKVLSLIHIFRGPVRSFAP